MAGFYRYFKCPTGVSPPSARRQENDPIKSSAIQNGLEVRFACWALLEQDLTDFVATLTEGHDELTKEEFVAAAKTSATVNKYRRDLHAKMESRSIAPAEDNPFVKGYLLDAMSDDPDAVKFLAREYITALVGDPLELFADLSKRVALLERMVMLLSNELLQGNDLATSQIGLYYKDFVTGYLQALQAGIIYDRIDKDPEGKVAIFQRLQPRITKVASILDEFYFPYVGSGS
jgi:hypothetical protein